MVSTSKTSLDDFTFACGSHALRKGHMARRDVTQAMLLLQSWKPDRILHVNRKHFIHTLITGAGQAGTPLLLSKLSLQSGEKNHRGITEDTERGKGKEREGSQGKDTFTNRTWIGESPYLAHGTQMYRNDKGRQKQKWASSATSVWSVMTHSFLVVGISWPTYMSNDVLSHLNMPVSNVNWQRWIKFAGFCGLFLTLSERTCHANLSQ